MLRSGSLLTLAAAITLVAWPGVGRGADPEVVITIEKNRFQPEEVKVKAGVPFVLVVSNKDAAPEEFDSKDLRLEKVVPAGKTVRIRVPALKAGAYRFVGEYHEATAKGRILAE
jgi:plastocyanin